MNKITRLDIIYGTESTGLCPEIDVKIRRIAREFGLTPRTGGAGYVKDTQIRFLGFYKKNTT